MHDSQSTFSNSGFGRKYSLRQLFRPPEFPNQILGKKGKSS